MTQTTKSTHAVRFVRGGDFAGIALCGRRVNRMSLVNDEDATCPKCAKAAAIQIASAV